MDIKQLKERKEQLGISYDELAIKTGLPRATVTNVMLGYTKHPRIDTIQTIASALGLDSIWTAEDYANGVKDTKKISITADQEDIFDKTNEVLEVLGEKGKELIIEFCDMIIKQWRK